MQATPVSLAQLTTLGIGGAVEDFVECSTAEELAQFFTEHLAHPSPPLLTIIGGGSNIVAADDPMPGTLLRLTSQDIRRYGDTPDGRVEVRAEAGAVWDEFVAWCVQHDLAGVECLSGIPGLVGAAPLQNIGAYGQEVASCICAVEVVHRQTGMSQEFGRDECGFAYRRSHFKGQWLNTYLVTAVRFRLRQGGRGELGYGQVRAAMQGKPPTLAAVRNCVMDLRRAKSMLIDPEVPSANRRSVGSFFLNPLVSPVRYEAIANLAAQRSLPSPPGYVQEREGRTKIPAAWLVENAGFTKGYRRERVGISTDHSLALINLGNARSDELVNFAADVRLKVFEQFRVRLQPEPVFIGFDDDGERILEGRAPTR